MIRRQIGGSGQHRRRRFDQGEDIEEIANHYLLKFRSMYNASLRGFSRAATEAMLAYEWPGNVRELVNLVQRAAVMAEGRFIQPKDLGLERIDVQPQVVSLEDARAQAERAVILRALSQGRNRISHAAALLGVSRLTLYRLIEKHKIRADSLPDSAMTISEGAHTPV